MTQNLPEPNHVIADKYVIEASLGVGGMGAVYAVTHRVTGKKLALKCLLPQYLAYPELVERFMREAQAAGRIQHRHVVDVFDVGRDGDVLYLVMPLLEGKSLAALLRERTHSLSELLAIVLRAMEGVAAAHAQGIVHRDLKPDNIFVCVGPSGRLDDPKVLDFGISKLDDEGERHALTKSGVLMGTPHYMSFEQLNSQRDVDARADVYALGVILYETLAGELPYVAESAPALAIRMMSGPPKPLSALRPDLPAALTEAVMKAIERDRDQRFESVASLREAVAPFVEDADVRKASSPGPGATTEARSEPAQEASPPRARAVEVAATLLDTPPPARLTLRDEPERLHRPKTSHSSLTLLAGAALALVLGLGVTLWLTKSGSSAPQAPTEPEKRAQTVQPSSPQAADEQPVSSAKRKVKKRRLKRPNAGAAAQANASGQEDSEEYEEYEEEEEESAEAPPKDPNAPAEDHGAGANATERAEPAAPAEPVEPASEPAQPTRETNEAAPSPGEGPGPGAPELRPGTQGPGEPAPPPPLPDKAAPEEPSE